MDTVSPLGGNTYPLKLPRETSTRAPRQPLVSASIGKRKLRNRDYTIIENLYIKANLN